jgi:hypothetical protein
MKDNISAITIEQNILRYANNIFNNNENNILKDTNIYYSQKLADSSWTAYIILYKYKQKQFEIKNKNDSTFIEKITRLTLYSDGIYITNDLVDSKTLSPIPRIVPPLNYSQNKNNFYDEKYLITKSPSSDSKYVVFSDPQCPRCKIEAPKMIKNSQDKIYFYLFPMGNLFPSSVILSKIMVYIKQKSLIDDLELKIFQTDFSIYFDIDETNELKVIQAFNDIFETNVTLRNINTKLVQNELQKQINLGISAFVKSVPTLYKDDVFIPNNTKNLNNTDVISKKAN